MLSVRAMLCAIVFAAAAMFAAGANAAVGVANSAAGVTAAGATASGSGELITSASFDASGGNAVALFLTTEGIFDDASFAGTLTASFAGQSMTALTANQGAQSASIFYLLNPSTASGAFTVTTDAGVTADLAYSAIALSNVLGVADTDTIVSTSSANTTALDLSYTTNTDGALVLGSAANNDYNNARPLSLASGNPDTNLLSHTVIGTSGHFHTYGDVPTAGNYTDGYLGQYQRTAIVTVAFDAVPEPTCLALLGLAALPLLRRRRLA